MPAKPPATPETLDPLLVPYAAAKEEAEARRALEPAFAAVEPLLRRLIARRWSGGGAAERQGEEDALGETRAALLARLRRLREDPGAAGIGDWSAFAARTAHHVCDTLIRRRAPRRAALKSQLSDLLNDRTSQKGFALWSGAPGERWCGFSAWRERGARPRPGARHEQLRRDPAAACRKALPGEDARSVNPAVLVAALLNWCGGPIELDDLVDAVAALRGVKDARPARPSGGEPPAEDPVLRAPDPRAEVAVEVEQRLYLRRLWAEIRELPPRQRAALLLNLKDDGGRGVLALFPLRGAASLEEIAAALELPWEAFAALWNELPLEDARIAALLGCARQQVINLRKVARERLARRMRRFEAGEPGGNTGRGPGVREERP